MLTVEIKINGRVIEVIEVVQKPEQQQPFPISILEYEEGLREYRVNGIFTIEHRRGDGHRVLARKALDAVKRMKR